MRLTLLIACLALTACTVYKTGDRDYFNSNAVAGAPKTSSKPVAERCAFFALKPHQRIDSLGLDLLDKNEDIQRLSADHETILIGAAQRVGELYAAACALTFSSSENASDVTEASRIRLHEFSRTH